MVLNEVEWCIGGKTDEKKDNINNFNCWVCVLACGTALCERKFAEEHNLLPAENEIIEATNRMREVGESTEESHLIAKSLINAMGLSEDEYWNDLKPRYEMTPALIRENVHVYCQENGLPMPDPFEADYEVKDTELFD